MSERWSSKAKEIAPAVLDFLTLWRASGQAFSRRSLCSRLGCDDRALRLAIVELREHGHLIIAEETGGYRLAQSAGEVLEYTASLKSRIRALRQVVDAMEAAAAREFLAGELQQLGLFR